MRHGDFFTILFAIAMPFTDTEKAQIAAAIGEAEKLTTAEIRIYVEPRCPESSALQRAKLLFAELNMHNTLHRNAVLIYVALLDRRFALFGDTATHTALSETFWWNATLQLQNDLAKTQLANALCHAVINLGKTLAHPFPDDGQSDNFLPNEILIGDGF